MGVLADVLAYKKQKDAMELADVAAIPTAVDTFITARRNANNDLLNQLNTKVTAASHGLKIDPNTGSITRDMSLQSPLDQLIEKGKAAEAAKNLGNRELWQSITGLGGQAAPAQPAAAAVDQVQADPLSQIQAPEIDPFTGKPTTKGLQTEQRNKLISMQQEQEVKKKVPTAQQKSDLAEAKNAAGMLDQMEADAKKLPTGYNAIWQNVANFFTRGAANPDLVTYNDTRPAAAVGIYRTLTGDTRLSDSDAKARALPLLWDSDEDSSVRGKKFDKLRRMAQARVKLVSEGKYTTDDQGNFITPLAAVEAEAVRMGSSKSSSDSVPKVGGTFNGEKVLKVKRIG